MTDMRFQRIRVPLHFLLERRSGTVMAGCAVKVRGPWPDGEHLLPVFSSSPGGMLREGGLEDPFNPSLTQAAGLFWLYLPALFLRNTDRRGRKQEHRSEPRCYLEKLHTDAGEHELKQRGDNHDVPDGPDGNEHALNHVLRGQEGGVREVLAA